VDERKPLCTGWTARPLSAPASRSPRPWCRSRALSPSAVPTSLSPSLCPSVSPVVCAGSPPFPPIFSAHDSSSVDSRLPFHAPGTVLIHLPLLLSPLHTAWHHSIEQCRFMFRACRRGVKAGETVQVQVPAGYGTASATMLEFAVPAGSVGGQKVQVMVPNSGSA
jgi:hypothetical protein